MIILKIRNIYIENGYIVADVWAKGRKRKRNERNRALESYVGRIAKYHIIPVTYKMPI